ADALAVGHHADDTVARHGPAFLEFDGHVVLDPADGQHLCLLGLAIPPAAASRPAELEPDHLGEVEPPLLALTALAAPALARRRRGDHRPDYVLPRPLRAADCGMPLVDGRLRQAPQAVPEPFVGIVLADAAEGRYQQAAAKLRILSPQRVARRSADCGARLAG